MAKVNSINSVEVYEKDGTELTALRSNKPSVTVRNHWNRNEFVVIEINDVTSYTVCADDLIKAIQNAQNV